jgi:hypothetical protein
MPALKIPKFKEFSVPSLSRKGKAYKVRLTEAGEADCECPDYQWNADPRYRCKHIRNLLLKLRKGGQ